MAYWKAKNGITTPAKLPRVNHQSEGNTDLPDGKSGSSPLQKDKFTTEQLIAQATKTHGPGVTVQPVEKGVTDTRGRILPGVDANARTAYYNSMDADAGSYTKQSYKTKTRFRKKVAALMEKTRKRKSKTETSD